MPRGGRIAAPGPSPPTPPRSPRIDAPRRRRSRPDHPHNCVPPNNQAQRTGPRTSELARRETAARGRVRCSAGLGAKPRGTPIATDRNEPGTTHDAGQGDSRRDRRYRHHQTRSPTPTTCPTNEPDCPTRLTTQLSSGGGCWSYTSRKAVVPPPSAAARGSASGATLESSPASDGRPSCVLGHGAAEALAVHPRPIKAARASISVRQLRDGHIDSLRASLGAFA